MNKAIFLDRDGTLIEEVNFLHKPEQVRWIAGVPEALAALYKQGWLLIMVTNQSGVARGYFTMDDVNKVYDYMQNSLRLYGAQFRAMYCCPHHPQYSLSEADRNCSCRKPKPGMYLQAQRDWDINLTESAAFGDKLTDIEAPLSLGCRCFLTSTGYGMSEAAKLDQPGYHKVERCNSLAEGLQLFIK
ncbi:MAG: D-glycero-alpha-D-manno-heptose-1,7-bisphosphate 7-phosphatase [Candidatus Bruticola sp.]